MSEYVATTGGPVRGQIVDGMVRFLGIPYAAPPLGDLRWRPPVDPPEWQDTFNAFAFGPICAQNNSCYPGFAINSNTEDCLYLNVWVPQTVERNVSLPVMVWIPGGGLFMGGSDDYDPGALVRDGRVVFVSLNYRVSIFGFFSHPSINAEDHAVGNYGIMDQQLALHWVRKNIERFGGDPHNVTIFGESAGGASVLCHMASPDSAGLFHRAILQSCSVLATAMTASVESVETVGIELATAAGCDIQTSYNLRSIPTTDLLAANVVPPGGFGPGPYHMHVTVDGTIIPAPIQELFASGRFNVVPTMNGINRDEFTWFLGMMELATGVRVTNETYSAAAGPVFAAVSRLLPFTVSDETVPKILERYPAEKHESANRALAAAVGDAGLICGGGWRTTRMISARTADVYAYEFDVLDAPVAWPAVSFPYGSGHTQEIQFLFPLFHGSSGKPTGLSDLQQQLSRTMVHYWTTFARLGSPNDGSPNVPGWPRYEAGRDAFLLLTTPEPETIENFSETHFIKFWDGFYP